MADSITDLKVGRIVKVGNDPHIILTSQFLRKQQRKPVMKTKLRNLINGSVLPKKLHGGRSI